MLTQLQKAPFPWYGGKRHAAPTVWRELGDVAHYCELFAGSCAVLLERPHPCNRPYFSETVNDDCGLLINALRAIQLYPQATAEAASWYVSECDVHARHLALLDWVNTQPLDLLMGNPHWCDPVMGGYYLYGLSAWIGSGWCSGKGPWQLDPTSGRIVKRGQPGVSRQLPHVSNDGQGVHRPQTREPGVSRKLPHVSNDGQGVHRPQTREPGVSRQLPHVSDNGRGVHHAGTREPGVSRQLPHVSNNGRGVHRPQTREPGVMPATPSPPGLPDTWEAAVEADYAATEGFHPMTMPELRRWFAFLSARLRHVRLLHGDWTRLATTGALKTLMVRQKQGVCGIFIDPPYSRQERNPGLYRVDATAERDLATECRTWCLAHGDDPDYRIVLAGFAGEGHEELEAYGWRCVSWFTEGHLRGGMGEQQQRERLWASPGCLGAVKAVPQMHLWETTPCPPTA